MSNSHTNPVTDADTFAVLDDALSALAERKSLWLGDDTVLIHLLASLIDQAQRALPEAVFTARENGATRGRHRPAARHQPRGGPPAIRP